jgi:hypothetical protein
MAQFNAEIWDAGLLSQQAASAPKARRTPSLLYRMFNMGDSSSEHDEWLKSRRNDSGDDSDDSDSSRGSRASNHKFDIFRRSSSSRSDARSDEIQIEQKQNLKPKKGIFSVGGGDSSDYESEEEHHKKTSVFDLLHPKRLSKKDNKSTSISRMGSKDRNQSLPGSMNEINNVENPSIFKDLIKPLSRAERQKSPILSPFVMSRPHSPSFAGFSLGRRKSKEPESETPSLIKPRSTADRQKSPILSPFVMSRPHSPSFAGFSLGRRKSKEPESETPSLLMVPSRSLSGSNHLNRSDSEQSLTEKYGKLEEVLGKGSFATVRLCCPSNSTKKYAVKEFRKKNKNETKKDYVRKLIAEFCISSSLDHENIVKSVDLIKDSVFYF